MFKHLTSVEEVEDGLVYLSYIAFTRVFFLVFSFFSSPESVVRQYILSSYTPTKHHKAGNMYSEFQEEKMDWDCLRE